MTTTPLGSVIGGGIAIPAGAAAMGALVLGLVVVALIVIVVTAS